MDLARYTIGRWRGGALAATAVALLAFSACYPGEVTNLAQTDIVATLYDRGAPWGTFSTAAVLDSVVHIVDPDNPNDTLPVSRDFDDFIIERVRMNFEDKGYTLIDPDAVDPDNPPDAFVLISVTASENWVAWQNWPWYPGWGWYPGYPGWGPGWGWWYPCCGSISVANYRVGTLLVDMLNANAAANDTIPVLWTAAMNGMLPSSGSSSSAEARLRTNIDQAFTQSEYLEVN